MECTVQWNGPGSMSFHAATGSGHWVNMDGAPEGGGRNLAPRPMEMMLVGAGGCSAYDVVLILQRGRHKVLGCEVKLQAERAEVDPKVFTKIHMHFVVKGRQLNAEAVGRAVALSHEKYCSATVMLGRTAEVTTSFEVLEAD
ncbi:OsmC family protein [Inhella proteolytica]|uniref:OsmC family protein n=1 Tax=Inhella proteolytica TaxID=2795029 RepID=A0A931J338_9BURK|nr:OsmC family protein [Inhella proteolytica]MBH9576027.1 OsmC family protein [Inhella proteolytica]